MRTPHLGCVPALAAFSLSTGMAAAGCQLQQIGALPVDMHGGQDLKMPTSLYGRGLAELRLGEKAQGQEDLAAAEKLDSGSARHFEKMGLTP